MDITTLYKRFSAWITQSVRTVQAAVTGRGNRSRIGLTSTQQQIQTWDNEGGQVRPEQKDGNRDSSTRNGEV